MNKHSILEFITNYKESSAFLAAMKLNIFDVLIESPMNLENLAKEIKVDKTLLQMLLSYLMLNELVEEKDEIWQVSEEFKKDYVAANENILAHELNICNKWVTAETIEDCVKRGLSKRKFDIDGFSLKDKNIYSKAMYGNNVRHIAFWIKRIAKLSGSLNILEMGRSTGNLALELKKSLPESKIKAAVKKEFFEITKESVRETEVLEEFAFDQYYDVICIFNTIHYWSQDELNNWFKKIKKVIKKDSLICVIDIFVDEKNSRFEKNFLLDWITHGGVFNFASKEVEQVMQENGLSHFKTKDLPDFSSKILFFKNEAGDVSDEQ